jgi:hypothetical protein
LLTKAGTQLPWHTSTMHHDTATWMAEAAIKRIKSSQSCLWV